MTDKLVPIPVADVPIPCWITNIGNYDTLPEPHREVTCERFWYLFHLWPTMYLDNRYVRPPNNKRFHATYIFWKHDQALAIVLPEHSVGGEFTSPPTYWIIGCEHNWRLDPNKPDRMFMHPYICNKCGLRRTLDSSG
jgi:hypothetical protein